MGITVIDSTDLSAQVQDATGEPLDSATEVAKSTEAPEKPAEAKAAEATADEAALDVEGEDGLTPRQKTELTEKMQRAIGKKHRLLKDAEEFAAEQYNERRLAESRAEAQEREIQRLKTQLNGKQPEVVDEGKPDRAKFETDEAYRDAVDDWRVDQKFKAKEAKEAQAREEQRQADVIEAAKSRVERAMELVPDYREVTESSEVMIPTLVSGYMQESEMFAELGYYFAKHPSEAERLSVMKPAQQLVEVGKIESKLSPFAPSAKADDDSNGATPSPKPPKAAVPETVATPSKPRVSSPIRPLSSGSAVQVEKDESQMDTREVISKWAKDKRTDLNRRKRH
jgi:hypothetical protein